MQQIFTKLPTKIALRWRRQKLELQLKEVDFNDLVEWLGTEVQFQEMAFVLETFKSKL